MMEGKKNTTVIVCTCDRPKFLSDALESVRTQTSVNQIGQVIVSENGTCEDSKKVCDDFPELPILYIKQIPPIAPLLHLPRLTRLIDFSVTAILHDDDWWAPRHLEKSLKVLNSDEQCVGVYTSQLQSFNRQFAPWTNYTNVIAWLACKMDFSQESVVLDQPAVMLACILNASLHYSTLVGKTAILSECFRANAATENTFDNDRSFPVLLSQYGTVGYIPEPNVFVRQHPFRDAWSKTNLQRDHMNMASETTRWLTRTFPDTVSQAALLFNQHISRMNEMELNYVGEQLANCVKGAQKFSLSLSGFLLPDPASRATVQGLMSPRAKRLLSEFVPPIAVKVLHYLKYGHGWESEIRRWQRNLKYAALPESRL